MDDSSPAIRRLCVGFGPQPPGFPQGLDEPGLLVTSVLDTACELAHVPRALRHTEHATGHVLALLPPGIDEPRVVADLVHVLPAALLLINEAHPGPAPLRLRCVLHQGIARLVGEDYEGPGPDTVRRLLARPPLEEEGGVGTPLVVLMSQGLCEDVPDPVRVRTPHAHARAFAGIDGG